MSKPSAISGQPSTAPLNALPPRASESFGTVFTPRPPEAVDGLPCEFAPCAQPCPKCGSVDISRRHRIAGESWSNCGVERERANAFVDVGRFNAKALRECLTHRCRTCQYAWETEVLVAWMCQGDNGLQV